MQRKRTMWIALVVIAALAAAGGYGVYSNANTAAAQNEL